MKHNRQTPNKAERRIPKNLPLGAPHPSRLFACGLDCLATSRLGWAPPDLSQEIRTSPNPAIGRDHPAIENPGLKRLKSLGWRRHHALLEAQKVEIDEFMELAAMQQAKHLR